MAIRANKDLLSCKRYEFVFKLLKPLFNIQGRIKTTAKKDLKKIICVKWKSFDRNLTSVFNKAKLKDANSMHSADFILDDILNFL